MAPPPPITKGGESKVMGSKLPWRACNNSIASLGITIKVARLDSQDVPKGQTIFYFKRYEIIQTNSQ